MTAFEKKLLSFSVVAGLVFCVPQNASAMHIMEGYLPPALCVALGGPHSGVSRRKTGTGCFSRGSV